MKRYNIYNKLFIVFCLGMLFIIILKAPKDKEEKVINILESTTK